MEPEDPLAELIATEESYVRSLEQLLSEYVEPTRRLASNDNVEGLRFGDGLDFVDADDMCERLFAEKEVRVILALHQEILSKLNALPSDRRGRAQAAKVLAERQRDFRLPYKRYTDAHPGCTMLVDSVAKRCVPFARLLQRPRTAGIASVTSLMIEPIQRVPRYMLLMKALHRSAQKAASARAQKYATVALSRHEAPSEEALESSYTTRQPQRTPRKKRIAPKSGGGEAKTRRRRGPRATQLFEEAPKASPVRVVRDDDPTRHMRKSTFMFSEHEVDELRQEARDNETALSFEPRQDAGDLTVLHCAVHAMHDVAADMNKGEHHLWFRVRRRRRTLGRTPVYHVECVVSQRVLLVTQLAGDTETLDKTNKNKTNKNKGGTSMTLRQLPRVVQARCVRQFRVSRKHSRHATLVFLKKHVDSEAKAAEECKEWKLEFSSELEMARFAAVLEMLTLLSDADLEEHELEQREWHASFPQSELPALRSVLEQLPVWILAMELHVAVCDTLKQHGWQQGKPYSQEEKREPFMVRFRSLPLFLQGVYNGVAQRVLASVLALGFVCERLDSKSDVVVTSARGAKNRGTRREHISRVLLSYGNELSQVAHAAWAQLMRSEDWHYDGTRNDAERRHTHLRPFASLTQEERLVYGVMANQIVTALVDHGFRVVQPEEVHDERLVVTAHKTARVKSSAGELRQRSKTMTHQSHRRASTPEKSEVQPTTRERSSTRQRTRRNLFGTLTLRRARASSANFESSSPDQAAASTTSASSLAAHAD